MFIDFVTYLEIRDDLPEEDKQYINSEIKKNMAKYHMEKDGIKYYVETERPGVGLHMGVEFCISMQHKRYKKYIKRCEYNSYFEGAINVKDSILDYYNEVRIKWIPVNERYPDNPRQVLCTYRYDYESGPKYENPEACGFGRMHKNVIAWAELPKPFIPDAM